jgi:nucleoside diphosphate kinase
MNDTSAFLCISRVRETLAKKGCKVPLWKASPFQLWSLLELLQTEAQTFLTLGRLLQSFALDHDDHTPIPDEEKTKYRLALAIVIQSCEEAGLNISAISFKNLWEELVKPECTRHSLSVLAHHVESNVWHELSDSLFLLVPSEKSSYFRDEPIWGAVVADKFPQLIEDIQEAGKCFATARYTACVFHLMRVMEGAVQYLGGKLKINLVREKNWHNILDEVDKAIKNMNPKNSKQKAIRNKYSAASAYLRMVKDAWRNDVMHPKATYTEEEAGRVFHNVKDFMFHLATKL